MRCNLLKLGVLILGALMSVTIFLETDLGQAQKGRRSRSESRPTVIPKTWDDKEMAALELPLAELGGKMTHVPAEYYYRIPEMKIYKSYPIYAPGKEPPGYIAELREKEPEIAFDASKLKTEEDWIKAGELVFNAPVFFNSLNTIVNVRSRKLYEVGGVPIGKDGTMPYNVYVIRQKGKVDVGEFACATCHTRVLDDGTIIRGAQGNYPLGRLDLLDAERYLGKGEEQEKAFLQRARTGFLLGYHAPWVKPDLLERFDKLTVADFAEINRNLPPGVQTRPGVSLFVPVQVPDLIGVKDRRYLDRTGLQQHRSIVDLMRYAALNQGISYLTSYGGYIPRAVAEGGGKMPDPSTLERYSDAQLYALAKYLYSLKPPPNPNKFDAQAAQGKVVFETEGCALCHTPPLYTSNKLTPARGFKIPPEHLKGYNVFPKSVGTDPELALKTRRGTGYYKVPSLKGVWYRGPFEHMGSVMTLEDWFDPRRLRDDYVPTGFRGFGVKTRAVKGHPFGLDLSESDRKALIAFLRTL
jgi:hypothetical protein